MATNSIILVIRRPVDQTALALAENQVIVMDVLSLLFMMVERANPRLRNC